MKYKKILLIGLGNIGLRHLESILKIKTKIEISCYDKFKIKYKEINKIIDQNKFNKNIIIKTINQSYFDNNYDLVIFASTANGRYTLLKNILKSVKINFIIFEKIVFQSESQFYKSLKLITENKIKAWVNCTRRQYKSYQYLAKIIENNNIKNFHMTVSGNFEFSSNLIHFIDLFSFLSNTDKMKLVNYNLHSIKNSKRKNFYEFSGFAKIVCENNNNLQVNNNVKDKNGVFVHLKSNKFEMQFNENTSKFLIIKNNLKINYKKFNFKHIYISQIMTEIYEDIIFNKSCNLTTINSSYFHHILFLKKFTVFFNLKKNLNLKSLPIT